MRPALVLSLLLLVAAAAGCGAGDDETGGPTAEPGPATTAAEPGTTDTATETETEAGRTALRVYLLRGEKLGVGNRTVESTPAVGRAALEELLGGPSDVEREAGLATAIPDGTRLLDLAVDGGHAVVDLSGGFASGGGSLSMQARVAQVVYTLTQFPTVERVSIRLDGEDVDAIGGEGVPATDLTRADFEGVTPAILVESPLPGGTATSPLRIRGTANTFEANFQVELLGPAGDRLVRDFVTATSGSGERGTFEASFPFELAAAGPGTLLVFEESAEDGSRINEVEIPLELVP